MKKVIILLIVLSLALVSCVIDFAYPMHIINHTDDTILIGYGHNNIIDSTKWFMYSDTGDSLVFKGDTLVCREYVDTKFNGKGKLSIGKDDIIPPDSSAGYHQSHHLFIDWPNQTGYFFVIKLENIWHFFSHLFYLQKFKFFYCFFGSKSILVTQFLCSIYI